MFLRILLQYLFSFIMKLAALLQRSSPTFSILSQSSTDLQEIELGLSTEEIIQNPNTSVLNINSLKSINFKKLFEITPKNDLPPTRNSYPSSTYCIQYQANLSMEDALNALQLKNIPGAQFFSVYDGHGGPEVARFAEKELVLELEKSLSNCFKENKNMYYKDNSDLLTEAMSTAFDQVEKKLLNSYNPIQYAHTGACALAVVILDKKTIVSANIGDCQGAIINFNGQARKINHKLNANSKKEQMRLKMAFADEPDILTKRGESFYVKNKLQPTRAFGDFSLKFPEYNNSSQNQKIENFSGPYISHKPDVKIIDIQEDDRYLIMASDGLWDWLDRSEVGQIFKDGCLKNESCEDIAKELLQISLRRAAKSNSLNLEDMKRIPYGARRKLHDDISIIVVDLKKK